MEESESDRARRQGCLCGGIDCHERADQFSVPMKMTRTWLRRSLFEIEGAHEPMTTPDQSKGDRSRDEVLAGEYVLGVLGAEERMKVEARLRRDPPFAAMVHRWEDNLSAVDGEYGFELPPAALFSKIEGQIHGQAEAQSALGVIFGGLWNSLTFWRFVALASLLVVAAVATIEIGLWNP